jgi:hypothetical protein
LGATRVKTDPLLLDWLSLAPTVCRRATGDAALGSRIGPDGKVVRGKSMSDFLYQYWYTEGTMLVLFFNINMAGLKKHFWPHMQAGWGRTGHTFGLFFWPHVQPKVDTLPKTRYLGTYLGCYFPRKNTSKYFEV